MLPERLEYKQVRELMKPGDVIAFSGKGDISQIIKWATRSAVSHLGVVFESKVFFDNKPQDGIVVDVMESTTLTVKPDSRRVAGVQRNRLSDHIKHYEGEIWWLPLSDTVRSKLDLKKFIDFLLHCEGREYDMPQAIKSAMDALDRVPLLSNLTCNVEDYSKFFCSELVAAALEEGGAIGELNSAEVTPIDLCMFNIYAGHYYQLKGETTAINGYNATSPEGFGL